MCGEETESVRHTGHAVCLDTRGDLQLAQGRIVESPGMEPHVAQRRQARGRLRGLARPQCAVKGGGLQTIFDAGGRSQERRMAQWIARMEMRACPANDRAGVPVQHPIEQAHRALMRDQLEDARAVEHAAMFTTTWPSSNRNEMTAVSLRAMVSRSGRMRAAGLDA